MDKNTGALFAGVVEADGDGHTYHRPPFVGFVSRSARSARMVMQRSNSWLAITSANATFGGDAGTADRVLVLRLNSRPLGSTSESVLSDEIVAVRNAGLSFMAITLQKALADTSPVPPVNRRHPDFSNMAVRIGRALGREAEAIAALQSAESDKSRFNLENDMIGSAIMEYFQQDELGLVNTLTGTAKEVLEELAKTDDFLKEKWTPKKLSNSLSRIWPHLESHLRATKEIAHAGYTKFTFHKPEAAA